jgi:hypothetical protein
MAVDVLTNIGAEIDARLAELRPLVEEYRSLLSATEALGEQRPEPAAAAPVSASRSKAPARKKPGRPKTKSTETETASAPRRRSRLRGSAAGAVRAASSAPVPAAKGKGAAESKGAAKQTRTRAVRGAAQQAILAALEHGSHTVNELTVVTAMSGQNIRENLRRMLGSGVVTRAKREGKAAYALAGAAAGR